jgi:hypothetical protein
MEGAPGRSDNGDYWPTTALGRFLPRRRGGTGLRKKDDGVG